MGVYGCVQRGEYDIIGGVFRRKWRGIFGGGCDAYDGHSACGFSVAANINFVCEVALMAVGVGSISDPEKWFLLFGDWGRVQRPWYLVMLSF